MMDLRANFQTSAYENARENDHYDDGGGDDEDDDEDEDADDEEPPCMMSLKYHSPWTH